MTLKLLVFNLHDREYYDSAIGLKLLYKEAIGEPYDREKWVITLQEYTA